MVVGERFAYGHLPKTGGDAAHAYLSAIPNLCQTCDPVTIARKHDTFAERDVTREHYLLSVRPLADWCLSVLTEAPRHPWLMRQHGWHTPADARRPENALRLDADGLIRRFLVGGRTVHRWLRMSHLLADILDYLDSIGRGVPRATAARMAEIPTKPRAARDAVGFFGAELLAELERRNPAWVAANEA